MLNISVSFLLPIKNIKYNFLTNTSVLRVHHLTSHPMCTFTSVHRNTSIHFPLLPSKSPIYHKTQVPNHDKSKFFLFGSTLCKLAVFTATVRHVLHLINLFLFLYFWLGNRFYLVAVRKISVSKTISLREKIVYVVVVSASCIGHWTCSICVCK